METLNFFKALGFDIKISLKKEVNSCYTMLVDISYMNRTSDYPETYKIHLTYTSSSSNCGLFYLDGVIALLDGVNLLAYLIGKNKFRLWSRLKNEEQLVLATLFAKYIIYESWLKLGSTKRLVFTHTGYKTNSGAFNENQITIFKNLVGDSNYESPVNKNSGYTQIHGAFDVATFKDVAVPNNLKLAFEYECG